MKLITSSALRLPTLQSNIDYVKAIFTKLGETIDMLSCPLLPYLLWTLGERPPRLMLSLNFSDCLGPILPGALILVRQRRLTFIRVQCSVCKERCLTFFLEVHMTQQTRQYRKRNVLERVSPICPRQRKNRGIPRIE